MPPLANLPAKPPGLFHERATQNDLSLIVQSADVIDMFPKFGLLIVRSTLNPFWTWAVKRYEIVGTFFIDHRLEPFLDDAARKIKCKVRSCLSDWSTSLPSYLPIYNTS